jgi:hypothetical protein
VGCNRWCRFIYKCILWDGGAGIIGSSPIVTGQVSGSALITVGATPAILTLVNETGQTVNIPNIPVQANIIITEVVI